MEGLKIKVIFTRIDRDYRKRGPTILVGSRLVSKNLKKLDPIQLRFIIENNSEFTFAICLGPYIDFTYGNAKLQILRPGESIDSPIAVTSGRNTVPRYRIRRLTKNPCSKSFRLVVTHLRFVDSQVYVFESDNCADYGH